MIWLLAALLVPGITAVVLIVGDRTRAAPGPLPAHLLALAASLVTGVATVMTVVDRPALDLPWIPAIGVRLQLGVDGISAPLLLLTAALGVLVVAHARRRIPGDRPGRRPSAGTFYGCLLLVELGALTTFLTRDAVVFFVAFELVLVPMWVLISRYGDSAPSADREGASARFLLYTALGSTLMLVGILALVAVTGTSDLTELAAAGGDGIDPGAQVVIAALLLVGLGIKVPLWPLHSWLPWAHTTAPTAGSVLLAAVLLKMGTYGIVRLVVAPVPDGFGRLAPFVAAAAVVGIIWAGLACLVERDLKRLIAWSSIAHMGFVMLGLASGTVTGLQAALFGNVAHGVISALLFFIVGGLKERWGTADLATARAALREVAPRLGFALVVGMAATLGLPGLAGFWGELWSMYAAWSPAPDRPVGWFRVFTVVAVIGTALAAAYALRVLREVWSGDRFEPAVPDIRRVEAGVVGVLVAAVVALGVYPVALLELTEQPATRIITGTGGTAEPGRPADAGGAP